MGALQAKDTFQGADSAFGPKEMYNLKQVYFFLCLHPTTLTSCQLDHNQFHSLFGSQKQFKGLWRPLFTAIDQKRDNLIDFEEFLVFITHLKRGDIPDRRLLCFRIFDSNYDGYVEKNDVRRIYEIRVSCRRKVLSLSNSVDNQDWEEQYTQFFNMVDENADGKFTFEDFVNYCTLHGENEVNQTLEILEKMFDNAIQETGIVITATDVKNSKPHIDWQDSKIKMGTFFCCSTQPPVFTKAPTS